MNRFKYNLLLDRHQGGLTGVISGGFFAKILYFYLKWAFDDPKPIAIDRFFPLEYHLETFFIKFFFWSRLSKSHQCWSQICWKRAFSIIMASCNLSTLVINFAHFISVMITISKISNGLTKVNRVNRVISGSILPYYHNSGLNSLSFDSLTTLNRFISVHSS